MAAALAFSFFLFGFLPRRGFRGLRRAPRDVERRQFQDGIGVKVGQDVAERQPRAYNPATGCVSLHDALGLRRKPA